MRARGPERPGGDRGGFVLLAMLWIIVAISAAAMAASVLARDAVNSSSNRLALARARWTADGCLARIRAMIDESTDRATEVAVQTRWQDVDAIVAASRLPCVVRARADGDALDLNAADGRALRIVLRRAGVDSAFADSLSDALLDWRDADDATRPLGAERQWYVEGRQSLPRNGPLVHVSELRRVRGWEGAMDAHPELLELIDVRDGRYLLDRTPVAVLATLPGMSAEALLVMQRTREVPGAHVEIATLAASMSAAGRDTLLAGLAELQSRVTATPDGWNLTATAMDGGTVATVSLQLVRDGDKTRVISRRGQW